MMTKRMLCILLLSAGVASSVWGQKLTLKVCDVQEVKGYLRVAVYASEADFLQKPVAAFAVEVKSEEVVVPCEGLPKGTYAISLFHDVNDNGVLDTGQFGIPTEPYGFSNDAEVVMGPPSFGKCSFLLKEDVTQVIHLK